MRGAKLMMSDDFGVGDRLPYGGPEQVLRLDQRVAEEAIAADHLNELLGRHGVPFPSVIHHKTIVDLVWM